MYSALQLLVISLFHDSFNFILQEYKLSDFNHLSVWCCVIERADSIDEMLDNESLDIEETFTVIRDYSKSSVDELDLNEGQLVCVIDASDEGNKLV